MKVNASGLARFVVSSKEMFYGGKKRDPDFRQDDDAGSSGFGAYAPSRGIQPHVMFVIQVMGAAVSPELRTHRRCAESVKIPRVLTFSRGS